MNSTPQHTHQLLSKRTERLKELYSFQKWDESIWMKVSVESDKYLGRHRGTRKNTNKD